MKKTKRTDKYSSQPPVHWIAFLYLLVEFFPRLETVDNMGSQWLFLSVLNIGAGCYLLQYRKQFPRIPLLQLPFISLILFTIVGAISFLSAFNPTESLVTYSRLLITLNAAVNLLIMMHLRPGLLRELLLLAGVIACIQSVRVFIEFYSNLRTMNYVYEIIYNIRANNGNKNILAASIAVKLPGLLYLLQQSKGIKRTFSGMGLFITVSALILLNARAAYISTFLILSFQLIGFYLSGRKTNDLSGMRKNIMLTIGITVISISMMQLMMNRVEQEKKAGTYGSLTERVESIDVSNTASSGRLILWKSALDFIGHHPLTGGGYGNWKIHTIPYEREIRTGFGSSKHAHNDFLETTADTGIPGGLIYLSIFILLAFLSYLLLFKRNLPSTESSVTMTLFLMLIAYCVDAFFNFPLERPTMQMAFALVIAGICRLFYGILPSEARQQKTIIYAYLIFLPIGCGVLYISKQVYTSFRTQNRIANDWLGNPKSSNKAFTSESVIAGLPWIPDLNEQAMPIACVKAKYLCEEGKYSEAFHVLDEDHSNPNLYYAEMVKSKAFEMTNRIDSAIHYARIATEHRPCNFQLFSLLNGLVAKKKDSAAVQQSYNEFKQHSKTPKACNVYCKNMLYCTGNPASFIKELHTIQQRNPEDTSIQFDYYFYSGGNFQNEKDNLNAILNYRKALHFKADDFYARKNLASCLTDSKRYDEAISVYTTMIGDQQLDDGRSYYNRGICLWNTGKQAEACPDLKQAQRMGFGINPAVMDYCSKQGQ